ncbi:MAG: UDP-glucuronate decarboxylase [Firmicutes bacterium]|nr:UDP-glucuronate decarboxylase [Bacillota bacterium]
MIIRLFGRGLKVSAKRILVTGGAGFIGSHLCEKLLEQGHEVICLDNYFTGSRANVARLVTHPYFELVRQDATLPMHFEVDEIYNLACPASPVHYQHNPIKTIKTSVLGAINVLDLASYLGAKVLHASTSEVYGDPCIHPQTENYWGNVNPIGRRSCYDEGKRCARGKEITIYGNGKQTRSFCYVNDLVDAMVAMMNTEQGFNGPVNLGNPAEFTILELAEKVLSLTDSGSKLTFRPLPQDDPKQRRPDITLAKLKLGWEPKISLEDGLKQTIAYFRRILA